MVIQTPGGVSISAERIPLKEIDRDKFVKKFQDFLLSMNKKDAEPFAKEMGNKFKAVKITVNEEI